MGVAFLYAYVVYKIYFTSYLVIDFKLNKTYSLQQSDRNIGDIKTTTRTIM